MRKLLITLLFLIAVASLAFIYGQSFGGGETLSAAKVKQKWGGSEKYTPELFKSGSYLEKSKMAYSIMTDRSLVNEPYERIRQLFGENDGFYFIDTYPTYIIQRGKNHSEETWQLVFRMNNQFKVRDIIMHKNCCEK